MSKKVRPEDLSEEDLRRLLIQKRSKQRRKRLEAYRKSGRMIDLSEFSESSSGSLSSSLDLSPLRPPNIKSEKKARKKRVIDGILLLVEITAIAGLLLVVFNGVGVVQRLNQEVALALVPPTPEPTPIIQAVVLPSGHTPPTTEGGATFNEAEIPDALRPLVQAYSEIPIPTLSAEHARNIQIPSLGVNAVIVMGDGWEQLKQGVGQHIGSSNPGAIGNLVLSAHNDIFGQLFRHLDKLEMGDEIIVYTNIRAYTYTIHIETQVVDPTATYVMDSTPDSTLTLISCYPYLVNTERIIVKAILNDG
jgi:sortase A